MNLVAKYLVLPFADDRLKNYTTKVKCYGEYHEIMGLAKGQKEMGGRRDRWQ